MRRGIGPMLAAGCLLGALVALLHSGVGQGTNVQLERVSVSSAGAEANGASLMPSVSDDGRFVAFGSDATNLVPGDTNARDVFVRDRLTGTTELVSVASDGTRANAPALFLAINGDGRYVVFESEADNLVPNDTNTEHDIFLRDRLAGTTERLSVALGGAEANDGSLTPSISADGRYVTFTSLASNLVAGDGNDDRDVFVLDRTTGAIEFASVATDGTQGNFASGGLGAGPARISGDGRYVVFGSFADNLVPDDTNARDDVFVRDRIAGTTERMSIATDGTEGNGHSMYGSVSDDGRFVFFHSDATNLVVDDTNGASDIFCRDRVLGETIRISRGPGGEQANGASRFVALGGDGTAAAFQSDASNLAAGDTNGVTDIFAFHLTTGELERVSLTADGSEPNGPSTSAAVSADGSVVAFQSGASNLVSGDTNNALDVFVRGKPLGPPSTPTRTPQPPTVPPTPTSEGRVGDVNGDGRRNSLDAALVLQFTAGLIPSLPPTGDVNRDGRTNAIDATLILQFEAGLLPILPPPGVG